MGTLQSSTGTVLCITLPPTGRNFIISGCISSPLIWDQGLIGVSCSANQRPVFAPLTNERPEYKCTVLTPGVWPQLPPLAPLCRQGRGSGSSAWPSLAQHRKHGVCFGVLASVEDEDQRIESALLISPGLNTSAQ